VIITIFDSTVIPRVHRVFISHRSHDHHTVELWLLPSVFFWWTMRQDDREQQLPSRKRARSGTAILEGSANRGFRLLVNARPLIVFIPRVLASPAIAKVPIHSAGRSPLCCPMLASYRLSLTLSRRSPFGLKLHDKQPTRAPGKHCLMAEDMRTARRQRRIATQNCLKLRVKRGPRFALVSGGHGRRPRSLRFLWPFPPGADRNFFCLSDRRRGPDQLHLRPPPAHHRGNGRAVASWRRQSEETIPASEIVNSCGQYWTSPTWHQSCLHTSAP